MKTFKKLFAYSAIFALLATMMPTYANAASYDAELTEAYAYAKGKSITTMDSIDNADMYGNLTRVAMAKMVANYVLDLNLQELDTTKECNFPDVSEALDAAYDNGVTKACQLGLMGVGIEKFNPNGIVTRAEFGTVLSRALWGEENNGGNPYYAKHLQALKDEGIMNKIDNPNMKEVRGYVMLMMMRADDAYTPTTGCSAEELLACILADDYDACIAACSEDADEEDLPGYATVSRVGSVDTQNVPYDAYQINVGTIKLTAGENGATVSSVAVSRDGLSNFALNSIKVKLKGSNIETAEKQVSKNSNTANVKFIPSLKLAAGESQNFDVIVTLNDDKDVNATHNFKVTEVTVSNGTASGTPVSLGTLKTTTAKSKEVQVTHSSVDTNLKAGDKAKTLAEVEFNFNDVAGSVNGFVLGVSGSTTDNFFEVFNNATAYIGNDKVGTVGLAKDKIVVLGLNKSVAKNDFVKIRIKADAIYSKAQYDFQLKIDSIDVNGLRPSPEGFDAYQSLIKVKGSDLKFKRINSIANVVPQSDYVKVFEAEFTSANDVIINKFVITDKLTPVNTLAGITGAVIEDSIKLVINNETIDLSANNLVGPYTGDAQIEVLAGQKAKVEIKLKLRRNNIPAGAATGFKYNVELHDIVSANDTSVSYGDSDVDGSKVNVKFGGMTMSKLNASSGKKNIVSQVSDQEIGKFSIRANNDDVTLKTLTGTIGATLTGQGGAETLEDAIGSSLTLYVEGYVEGSDTPLGSLTINGNSFIVEDIDHTIAKDKTERFVIVADFADVKDYMNNNSSITINATATVKCSNNKLSSDTKSLGKYTFVETKPTFDINNGSNNKVFTITIANTGDDDVTMTGLSLYIEGSQAGYAGTACLTNNSGAAICTADGLIATGAVNNGGVTQFTINTTEDDGILGTKEYYLILPSVSRNNDVRVVADTITLSGISPLNYGNVEAIYTNYSD